MSDARADLPIEQRVVTFEVHEDLGAHDAGEATDVLLAIHPGDTDVALPKVGERVVYDELQALVQSEVEAFLQLLLVHGGGLCHVTGMIAALLVEEDLHVLEPVLLPEEILELHAVLAVLLLRPGIELRHRRPATKHQCQGQGGLQERTDRCKHRLKLALGRPFTSAMVRISGFSGHAERP